MGKRHIGLTGGIASGKSVVAARLAELGAVVIDDDVLAREVVGPGTPGLDRVAERFGPGVLRPDGSLDRARLAEVVFADPTGRSDLEAIIHPLVDVREWELDAAAPDDAVVVHMVPLLVEVGWQQRFDQVIVVDVPESVQIGRLMARDGLSPDQARQRVAAQADRAARLAAADVVIDNAGALSDTYAQVDAWWAGLGRTPFGGRLVLVRHGESEYNEAGVWTGITDVALTAQGHADAARMGELLRDVAFDRVYTSCQRRAWASRDDLLAAHGSTPAVSRKTAALNERDYGDYTGLNKHQVRERVGTAAFADLRRSFDAPIPNGETLRDVYDRVVPWYRAVVVPALSAGETVLIVGHGNSCRALRKYIERISDAGIRNVEMDFDAILLYRADAQGRVVGTPEVRRLN